MMFSTVLIANRGEIACRAIRTLKRLKITSIAIYSKDDCNSCHVKEADMAIALEGNKSGESYLNIDNIIAAAIKSRAEAILPCYGFLSESFSFSNACENSGIVFIGPTSEQIKNFGLKHNARKLAHKLGIPIIPGTSILHSLEDALNAAKQIGYPIMLKNTAGGGGIGLKRCMNENDLLNCWKNINRLGKEFFNETGLLIERYINPARHIEVQIFGDGRGKVIALGERDCSFQRRHQKIVEETPAPNLPYKIRNKMINAAVRLGKEVNYRSVGTIEYIYDIRNHNFYFLEVNTRLQVEHTVTECVTNLDLVELMLKVAAEEDINWTLLQKKPMGHAIEVRFYAENVIKNFQPSPGLLTNISFPDNVRVDSGFKTGSKISEFYDPMIAKMIVHADTRHTALIKLQQALSATELYGIMNNLDYLRQITLTKEFTAGIISTTFLNNFTPVFHTIEVLKPGRYSTIQDFPGRLGYWNIGIPPSGPMDDFAFRIANRIVGNHESAAGLEFTLIGPELRFHCNAIIALTGAYCLSYIDGKKVNYWEPLQIKSGQILNIGKANNGCRTYLAVRNGLHVPMYLGSRSTFVSGKIGGHIGRTLQIGDLLAISQLSITACNTPHPTHEPQDINPSLIPKYHNRWCICALYGPHGAPDFFTPEYINEFFSTEWQVHHNSNRLGIRLIGPHPKWNRRSGGQAGLHPSNIHDSPYAIGSINFTGDIPVILTRDGPSLGGFVCPVTIANAEMWKIGQLKPGDYIRFILIDTTEALRLEKAQQYSITTLNNNSDDLYQKSLIHNKKYTIPSLNLSNHTSINLVDNKNIPIVHYRQAGDKYLLIEYDDNIMDLMVRLRVHQLMNKLYECSVNGIEELLPAVRSLQVRYNSTIISQQHLIELISKLETKLNNNCATVVPSRIIWLPISFENSAVIDTIKRYQQTIRTDAPWLPNNIEFIQRINGLKNKNEIYNIFLNATYLVLGLGDVYLGSPCAIPLDPRHRLLSSKYNPARTFTAEGSIGLGGIYMCIYSIDSPGGYQLIGRTLPIWNKFLKNHQFNNTPWLLQLFDQIRFYSVTERILNKMRNDFLEGKIKIEIEQTEFNFTKYKEFIADNIKSIENFQKLQSIAFDKEAQIWEKNQNREYKQKSLSYIHKTDMIIEDQENQKELLTIRSEIHGSIWSILVHPEDVVEKGDALIIIESMKMEFKVTAVRKGVIKYINCQVGMSVSPGDLLLELE